MTPPPSRYANLLSPLRIGPVEVRNRFVQCAHEKVYHQRDGLTTRREVFYQAERARGEVGLLITGHRPVHPTSPGAARGFPFGYRKEFARSERAVTDAVHDAGGHIFAQLNHVGMHGASGALDDFRYLLAPSPVPGIAFNETPKEMDEADIATITTSFADCAAVAREAGFDGVEVHAAHGYLLHQFMTPVHNKRLDDYGGSLENRLRFPLDVMRAVRERVGRDFAVGIRLSMTDLVPGSFDVDDAIEIFRRFERDGAIDYINGSAATYNSGSWNITPGDLPEGWALEHAARIRKALDGIPLFSGGGIRDPQMAEEAVASGAVDMVAMTRALITDPALPRKLREGREDEIVHCIRCNQGCVSRIMAGRPMTCLVNPAAGREELFGLGTASAAAAPKHWVVVGGGPAGMSAAAGLAERGHRVTLLEREAELGGQVKWIVTIPRREAFGAIVRDLSGRLERSGVDVRCGQAAGAKDVLGLAPDGVILATGSVPLRTGQSPVAPAVDLLPGIDGANVSAGFEALRDIDRIGRSVLVLDEDGTRYALGIAELLAAGRRDVHVLTRFNVLAPGLAGTMDQGLVYAALFEKGVKVTLNHWVSALSGDAADSYNLYTGEQTRIEGLNHVVYVGPHRVEDALHGALAGKVSTLHRIGDCLAPRRLEHAIYEGLLAGREKLGDADRYIEIGALETRDDDPETLRALLAEREAAAPR